VTVILTNYLLYFLVLCLNIFFSLTVELDDCNHKNSESGSLICMKHVLNSFVECSDVLEK